MNSDQVCLHAGVEAGGTKFVCAAAAGPDDVRVQTTFPTTTSKEPLGRGWREKGTSFIPCRSRIEGIFWAPSHPKREEKALRLEDFQRPW